VDEAAQVAMLGPSLAAPGPQQVATLTNVHLPWVEALWQDITLHIQRGDRIGVRGRNGSGKSTLLRVLAGELQPLRGEVKRAATTALLDQTLSSLPAHDSALQLLQRANPMASEGTLRTQLALLGLDAERSLRPLGTLSGGERVKAALAAVLYAEVPPQLLLLDEPGNHLDLASLAALEQMLNQYRGSVVIVSHDQALLDAVHLTHQLDASEEGWQLRPL
jgi:ATPase subunit of ABC transporter with duplicated ATPase domains